MITDADIKKLKAVFATKDDLKAMEHRQDQKFATKDDLKAMEHRQDQKFATKKDLDKTIRAAETRLREAIVKDIADMLQESVIKILNEHEVRLDRLEKRVGGFSGLS